MPRRGCSPVSPRCCTNPGCARARAPCRQPPPPNLIEAPAMPHVITLNAGSSSIKFALFELDHGEPQALAIGLVEKTGDTRHMKVRDGAGVVTHEESWEP